LMASPHMAGVRELIIFPVAIPIPLWIWSLDLKNVRLYTTWKYNNAMIQGYTFPVPFKKKALLLKGQANLHYCMLHITSWLTDAGQHMVSSLYGYHHLLGTCHPKYVPSLNYLILYCVYYLFFK
jgi:hypothetical protein